jgi:hypothetical protein
MQIQSINNFQKKDTFPNFKSAYPVYHWVAAPGGAYAPVVTNELTKKLHRKLVGFLNSSKLVNTSDKKLIMYKIKNYIAQHDADYRNLPIVRSFYSHRTLEQRGNHDAISFLLTGPDVEAFEENFAKDIGRYKSDAPFSAELQVALGNYKLSGMSYVTVRSKRFRINDIPVALHTKFQEVRDKRGRVKEYRLVDLKFCPNQEKNNPVVKYYEQKIKEGNI